MFEWFFVGDLLVEVWCLSGSFDRLKEVHSEITVKSLFVGGYHCEIIVESLDRTMLGGLWVIA